MIVILVNLNEDIKMISKTVGVPVMPESVRLMHNTGWKQVLAGKTQIADKKITI